MKKIFLRFSAEGEQQQQDAGQIAVNEATAFVNDPTSQSMYETLKGASVTAETDAEGFKFVSEYERAMSFLQGAQGKQGAQPAGEGKEKPAGEGAEGSAEKEKPAGEGAEKPQRLSVFNRGANKEDFSSVTKDNFVDAVKTTFGIEGKTDEEIISKFLQSASTQRKQASEYGQVKAQAESYEQLMNSLPSPLASAIKAFTENKPWESALNITSQLDYTKPFSELSPELKLKAIEHVTGNKMDAAALSKEENAGILRATERAFDLERGNIEMRRQATQASEEAEIQNVNFQINASIDNLKKEYPDIDPEAVKEVNDILTNPKKGISSLFLERKVENGRTVVRPIPDIAKRILFVLYGDEIIRDAATEQATMKTNEKIAQVLNASDKPTADNNTSNQEAAFKQWETGLTSEATKYKKKYVY